MDDSIFGPVTSRPPFDLPRLLSTKSGQWQLMKIRNYSDGDQKHWPAKPYRPSNEAGYLIKLASAWAEEEGRPETSMNYYLSQLPEGYALFEIDQPGREAGQVYKRLFGHSSGRFWDSILRFQAHFLWLMKGMQDNCSCVLCHGGKAKPVSQRGMKSGSDGFSIKPRIRRTHAEMLAEDALRRSSSTDSANVNRSKTTYGTHFMDERVSNVILEKRLPRGTGPSHAVDEEGNKDVYKECLSALYRNKGARTGIEDDIFEEDSIDWKAERDVLPIHLTQIEQQHSFVPRIGELVLWCNYFPHDHYLMPDPETAEFKFYTYEQDCFHGFPDWRGGLITAVPTSTGIDGPTDFPDILDAPKKKTSLNSSGFRVETFPDPNDPDDKSLSLQYKYVPLRNIRPAAHWQRLLYGFPQKKLHESVHNVLKCMTTVSVLEKFKFTGQWPNASIHCKGIYLGLELIIVGDTIRFRGPPSPSRQSEEPLTNIMVVTSIRVNLHEIEAAHVDKSSPLLGKTSTLTLIGKAYTSDRSSTPRNFGDPTAENIPVDKEIAKSLFRPVGAVEFARDGWFPMHQERHRYEISHEQVLGRLHEAHAVKMWTGQSQLKAKAMKRPSLDWDVSGILAGRAYASKHDTRLAAIKSEEVGWYWGDTRAQALDVETINGQEVGKYDEVRDVRTLHDWRAQLKVLRGDMSSVKDTSLPTRKGRPAGSKLVNGKVVMPGGSRDSESDEQGELSHSFGATSLGGMRHLRFKSSHMMQAAREDSEDAVDDGELGGATEVPESGREDEDEEIELAIKASLKTGETETDQVSLKGNNTAAIKAKTAPRTKQQIMESIEAGDETAGGESEEDDLAFLYEPPPIRGGTEESEGGDYDPRHERETSGNELRKKKARLGSL